MGGQEPGGHDRELENTDTLSLTPEQSAGRGREGMPAESRVGDEVPLGTEVRVADVTHRRKELPRTAGFCPPGVGREKS